MVELTTAKYSEASSGQHLPTPREVWFPRGRTRYEWAAKFSIRWSPTHSRSAHGVKEPEESRSSARRCLYSDNSSFISTLFNRTQEQKIGDSIIRTLSTTPKKTK